MKNRTHFAHRVDAWDDDGQNVIEHLAGVEDSIGDGNVPRRVPALAQCYHHLAAGCARHPGQPAATACLKATRHPAALFIPAKGA